MFKRAFDMLATDDRVGMLFLVGVAALIILITFTHMGLNIHAGTPMFGDP